MLKLVRFPNEGTSANSTDLPDIVLKKFLARPPSISARAPDIFPACFAVALLSRRPDGRGRIRLLDVGGLAGVLGPKVKKL